VATVTVLAAAHINQQKVQRTLAKAGYATDVEAGRVRVARHGRWDAVDTEPLNLAELPDQRGASARRLLGLRPRDGVTCSFEGDAGTSDSWPTVVDIARAVAAHVPLAVLDDHAGTTYLVHPDRGLIGPQEYRAAQRSTPGSDLLWRLLGGGR
jgi:hypothetical protein